MSLQMRSQLENCIRVSSCLIPAQRRARGVQEVSPGLGPGDEGGAAVLSQCERGQGLKVRRTGASHLPGGRWVGVRLF